MKVLEKEIEGKRSDFEAEVRHRTADLDNREETIASCEKEMTALQKEVETFSDRNEDAVKKAVKSTTDQLKRDFESEKALLKARFEGEKNVLIGKIEALEKMVASQVAQINDLSKKSELAYEKVQDIANRAVTASRRDAYPASVHPSTVSVREDSQA